MSIIIRLQNLPLSAKSGDIRHFFGGLRIPNGGVHIVGGEKGDAFIAFQSDEDARLAMRKDGGKLMGSRVKLYLSSSMEMQHEIARITKDDDSNRLAPHEKSRRRSPLHMHERSSDIIKHYRSDSPLRSRNTYHSGRGLSPHSRRSPIRRSRSPRFRSRSPRRRSRSPRLRSRSPRARSRSPRKRSRSPYIHTSGRSRSPLRRRSYSPIPRSISLRRSRSISPHKKEFAGYKHSFYESENGGDRNLHRDERNSSRQEDYFKREGTSREGVNVSDWINKNLSLKEEQAQLEKRIAEVLKTSLDALKKNDPYSNVPNTADVLYSASSLNPYTNPLPERGLQDSMLAYSTPNVNIKKDIGPATTFPPPNISYINSQNMSLNNERFPNPLPPIVPITSVPPPPLPMTTLPPMNVPPPIQMPPPVPVSNLPSSMSAMPPPLPGPPMNVAIPVPGYYITVSGLDPKWNFNEIQEMLKGTFVPSNNIKWEIDDHGMKTGTAFIKLSIREDFTHFLHHATYVYNGRLITVSECPGHVVHRYFLPEWPPKGSDESQNNNLYYRLKGLPYTVTYDDIIQFFQGLDIADIYIERENEKATGIGYVGFYTIKDFDEAFRMNGKNMGRRFIYMFASTKKTMFKLKKKRGDLLSQSKVLIPSTVAPSNVASDLSLSSPRRPLCTLLTGLPQDITPTRIKKFFKMAGPTPDAIHVTLNDKGRPNCRAYVEFNIVQDFDAALKCHGTNLDGKIICVKQILFDEMVKILNTQRALHFFEKPPTSNIEKFPYLWQPSDDRGPPIDYFPVDDNYRMQIGPETTLNRPEVQVFEYGNQSREPTAVQGSTLYEKPQWRQHKDSNSFQNENWPLPSSSLDNRESDNLFSSPKQINSDRFATKMEEFESNRNPVKFEVKTKLPISKKSELNDAFDRSLKPEFKKKLTKLSPEKSSIPEIDPIPTKTETTLKEKKYENSSKISSQRNTQKREARKSPEVFASPKAKDESRASRSIKPGPKYKGRSNEKRRDDYSYKNYPRNPSPVKMHPRNRRSRSMSPYDYNRYPMSDSYLYDEREAVVQISNVDPIIEGPELADFLHGFDVNHDKIIRRIERGKKAWDIRVSFRSYREAERAIRFLNGSYLNGIPVDMFFVD